jgi:hypothetical protein
MITFLSLILLSFNFIHADSMTDAMLFVTKDQCLAAKGFSIEISQEQQNIIDAIIGKRSARTEHALWHASRSKDGLDSSFTTAVSKAYGPYWVNPDKLCPAPGSHDKKYNPAGEDFLFMHRAMIGKIRRGMLEGGLLAKPLPCISGWDQIPDPAIWPIPDNTNKDAKSEGTYKQLKFWEKYFISNEPAMKAWRQSVTLSQLGFAMEFTIHNNLHMRYATERPAVDFQSPDGNDGANIPLDGIFPVNWNFDKPTYNWLADPYGAALNPYFWKIHGFVDNAIDKWLADNGKNKIAVDCGNDSNCYQWQGQWMGQDLSKLDEETVVNIPKGFALVDFFHEPPSKDKNFKISRMALTRLGVIKDDGQGDHKGGPKGIGPNVDPYQAALNNVCGSN